MTKRSPRKKKTALQGLILLIIVALVALYNHLSEPHFQFHHDGIITTYSTEQDGDLTQLFVQSILGAKDSIHCLNYAIRDKQIIQALNTAAERGINVEVVYDPTASKGAFSKFSTHVKQKRYEGNGLMHMKLLAIDNEVAFLGTANFTRASLAHHANTVLCITHPGIAALIQEKVKAFPYAVSSRSHSFTLPNVELQFAFLPEYKGAADEVKKLLRSAKKTIDVAMFTFTRRDFAKELIDAKKRGVSVNVRLDSGSMKGTSKIIAQYLKKGGVSVEKGVSTGLYHHKLALIDKKTWIIGSANWTKSAFGRNDEYLLFLKRLDTHDTP